MRYVAVTRAAEIVFSEDGHAAFEVWVGTIKTAQRREFGAAVI
jgi:hypothetical protein